MSDPHIDSVSLLLHCEGADGSTTLTDSGPLGLPITFAAQAVVSTALAKFGASSVALSGPGGTSTADRFGVLSGASAGGAFDFGTGAWTAECWVYWSTVSFSEQCAIDFTVNTTGATQIFLGIASRRAVARVGNTFVYGTGTQMVAGSWHHLACSHDGTTLRIFLNGELQGSVVAATPTNTGRQCRIGCNSGFNSPWVGNIDEVRVTKGVARYTAAFTPPTAPFPDPTSSTEGQVEADGPLGAFSGVAYSGCAGPISAASPLGVFLGYGESRYGEIAAASPLGSSRLLGWHDFTGVLGDTITRYVVDITDSDDNVLRAPISSWQATLQTGAKNYVQCVIPACAPYVDTITDAVLFSIKRLAELPDGTTVAYEMASAPDPTATLSQGGRNYTAVMSGYSEAFAADENPPATYDRKLQKLRTITTMPTSLRARCGVDWLLRPGHRAFVTDSQSINVAFINYYVSAADEYMDVGNRGV